MLLSSPLVTTDWLNDNINHKQLIIFDASMAQAGSKAAYKAETIIQGARRFDFSKEVCDLDSPISNTMPSEEKFQSLMREFDINNDSCIIVYDEKGIYSSARAWWMFRAMGFDNVAVLDGGLPDWLAKGYPITESYQKVKNSGDFIACYNPDTFVDQNAVLAQLGNQSYLVLDARGKNRFLGDAEEPRAGMRAGHIPNARSMPYSDIVKNGFMLDKDALQTVFHKRLAANADALIFSCGSGVTACILALGAHIVGYENLAVYDGSWSEWGASSELPIELGEGLDIK
ncbi:sulfurtransferase [Pseudoalteromonas sp. C2R02]|uniref:sulfurtransferase n=1 Tax=Pseudoalteromonas sp. C2R02 TaxID=2841565 RepID=UPI001C08E955|nr:sulfurtransferase [Pseudoalteromonas sp. C2R02]MBU2969973.1 sulfurtransferase [Pseudoalteromonas sp. C2R02]